MLTLDGTQLNLADVADGARRRLDPVHWDFFAGGAGDERTLRANEDAFTRRWILPRILRGTRDRDLRISLLGRRVSMPVLIAPTAFHRLAHPEGEVATARAAADADTIMVVSMAATRPVEEIAAVGGPLWFQLYPQSDLAFTAALVRRAEAAGCRALVVTVDSPVFGRRERDLRHRFVDLPPGLVCENMRDPSGRIRDIEMDAGLDWGRIGRLRELTTLPILLKGILHPADARLAVAHGIDGVLVSNHGGRQLDAAVPTLDALPGIVAAVEGRLPVLLDGGIRRGTDILVALALGATAVLIGRPVLWGLAVGGTDGVRHVLDLLYADLDRAMALAGAAVPGDLTGDLVTTAAPG
ncbi:alpha-hydroxy acid oxidase [Verrucosispora sp. NA02020]|uniref:alpha-hydroxy acid oxidase n=1 Tax=Verrucosispora sp. NA02020 TaxID=2742132 RepID=UPI0015926E78|nr:alpha-hydroxy acid oxidase [Verrucosispora sp. NA02020]QKW13487.1 alpha-hydroxy-acid oxidizing protein [Verrucosispora sp. NA02020]